LEVWRLDEHLEPAVEQPLKCELLHKRPEGIERKEHQDCWLPDWTPLHHGERDQPGTDNCSADTDRQKTRGEVITTEAQIAPRVGPSDRDIKHIRTQSQASDKEGPALRDVQAFEAQIHERHRDDERDIAYRDTSRVRGGRLVSRFFSKV